MTRVLIADDHPLVLRGIESVLSGTSYKVVAMVADGAAVLDALPTAKPDILVLDIRMPKRTGLDVLRTLRCRGDNRPVVLLTVDPNDNTVMEAIQFEVNGFIMKEGAESQIVTCLDHIMKGERWIDRVVLQRALDVTRRGTGAKRGPLAALTPRERSIAKLVSEGRRNKEIAAEFGITEGTVKVSLHRMYERLGISNRTELAIMTKDSTDV